MNAAEPKLLRIGHKGADRLVPGNTISSFHAAVEAGVDIVELDILRPSHDFNHEADWKAAEGGPAQGSGPLLVAHDWAAAAKGHAPTMTEALDAFTQSPLNAVELDLDLKIAGREDEVVAALKERGLLERAMVSGMEVRGLRWLAENAPEVRLGWTVPRLTQDWRKKRGAGLAAPSWQSYMRRRLPGVVARRGPKLGAWAVWVYHPLITRRLVRRASQADLAVVAWTVDTVERMRELRDLGVAGICSNDPRLFAELD
jgi:glycerophosphoryl diester phosphodiesterase